MGTRSAIAQQFISAELDRALDRCGLPVNHQIREALDSKAELVGERDAAVRIIDGDRMVMLSDYIAELKTDPRYANSFPPDPKTIPTRNERLVRQNFAEIAAGTVRVVDVDE